MELISLYIENYKKYQNKEISFKYDKKTKLEKEIFKEMIITAFVGENGSGKTTILSFITIIFRYLHRHREKIPCEFILNYIIENENIVISKRKNDIFIRINDIEYYLMEFDIRKKINVQSERYNKQIGYDDIIYYLPNQVVVTAFDIEYNIGYNFNYYGHRIISNLAVDDAFVKTATGMDISLGVLEFFNTYYENNNLKYIFDKLKFVFRDEVMVYINYTGISEILQFADEQIIQDLMKGTRYKTINHFIDYIASDIYWNRYIINDGNDKWICFDIRKFLKDNDYNYNLAKLLIEYKLLYINEFYICRDGKSVGLHGMSTGEKIFLCRMFFLLAKIDYNSIVIIEEPELHLNHLWVKQLIPILQLLFEKYKPNILLSTHDYGIINMLFPSQIILLQGNYVSHPNFNSFLANYNVIFNQLYPQDDSFNLFEEQVIDKINDNQGNKMELLNSIGESLFKYLIYKKIGE